ARRGDGHRPEVPRTTRAGRRRSAPARHPARPPRDPPLRPHPLPGAPDAPTRARAGARADGRGAPSGRLLVEEGDLEAFAVADPAHPASAMVARVQRLTMEAMQAWGRIDLHLGRRCPELLARLGLADVGAE